MTLIAKRPLFLLSVLRTRMDAVAGRRSGFSLIELFFAMLVTLVVLSSIYSVFIINNKKMTDEQQIADMHQNARSSMDILAREIRMAGYNLSSPPTQASTLPKCSGTTTATTTPCRGIVAADGTSITFTAGDPNEQITYDLAAGNLRRQSHVYDDQPQIVASNITSLAFTYANASNLTTTSLSDIKKIVITVTAKTAKPDPAYTKNSGYRTYTLMSEITPRNLVY